MRFLALLLLSGCASAGVQCEITPIGEIAKQGQVLLSWVTLPAGQKPPCGKRGCAQCNNGACFITLVEDPNLADFCPAMRFVHELGHAMGATHE